MAEHIGELVRSARQRRGLSQKQLAEKVGTSQSAVSDIETGISSPTFQTLLKVMDGLSFSVDVVITPQENRPMMSWRHNSKN